MDACRCTVNRVVHTTGKKVQSYFERENLFPCWTWVHTTWLINVSIIIFMKIINKHQYFMLPKLVISWAYSVPFQLDTEHCTMFTMLMKRFSVVVYIHFFSGALWFAVAHTQQLNCNWCQGTMTLIWWWKSFCCVCSVLNSVEWGCPAATF